MNFRKILKPISLVLAGMLVINMFAVFVSATASASEIGDFNYSISDDGIVLEKYIGEQKNVVINSSYLIDGEEVAVYAIGEYAFEAADIESVVLEDGLCEIREGAFYECDSLTEVIIPESVMSVGDYAFDDCNSLKKVTLLCNDAVIGEMAFGYYSINTGTSRNPVYEYYIVEDFVLLGYNSSSAYEYAQQNGISFESIPSTALGDINQDNRVDISDLVRLKKISAQELSNSQSLTDINGDGVYADAVDVLTLRILILFGEESLPKYTVTFEDASGNILKEQEVYSGFAAAAPAAPEVTGYAFIGWSVDFLNVRSDLTVKPVYEQLTFEVTFTDYDGVVLSTQSVAYGGSAVPPENPSREGYIFDGWDGVYTGVTAAQTVVAKYELIAEKHTVTFTDYDGRVISSVEVSHGGVAALPDEPVREGYIFSGWSGSYANVTADSTVIAEYIESSSNNIFKVNSVNGELGDTVTVAVELTGSVEMNGFELILNYDSSVLSLTGIVGGSGVEYNHIAEKGQLKISYLNKQCVNEYNARVIITLNLEILTEEAMSSVLDLECDAVFDASELFVLYSVIDGQVVMN